MLQKNENPGDKLKMWDLILHVYPQPMCTHSDKIPVDYIYNQKLLFSYY